MDLKPFHKLIEEFEGLRLSSYRCPAGVWTIGYGSTRYPDGKAVRRGERITKERALDLLLWDVAHERMPTLRKFIKVPLNNNELCALLSLCYNIGNGAFAKSSIVRKLNANAPRKEVAQRFMSWTRGGGKILPGLVRRRKAEAALFLTPAPPVIMFT